MNISPSVNSVINMSSHDMLTYPNQPISLSTSLNEKSELNLKPSCGNNIASKNRRIKRNAFDNLSLGSRLVLGGPLEFIPVVRKYNPIGMITKLFFKTT